MSDRLPAEVLDLLRSRGLACLDVFVASERKRQYTLLVEDPERRRLVLKYRDPSGGPLVESAFYAERRASYMPEVVEAGRDHILMRYHEGRRLRQELSSGPLTGPVAGSLVDILLHPPPADPEGESASPAAVRRTLVRNLMRLLTSGPMDAPRAGRIGGALRWWRARVVFAVAKRRIAAYAAASVSAGPPVYQHGDLHLNNVLLEDGGRVIVLDWERTFVGTPICDWLYFWPQYLRLAGPDETFDRFHEAAAARWPVQFRIFEEMLPLYAWAARSNPRFRAAVERERVKSGTAAHP